MDKFYKFCVILLFLLSLTQTAINLRLFIDYYKLKSETNSISERLSNICYVATIDSNFIMPKYMGFFISDSLVEYTSKASQDIK